MSEMTGKCQTIDAYSLMLGYLDGDNLDNDEREMLLFALYCESVKAEGSIAQKAIKQLNEQGRNSVRAKPAAALRTELASQAAKIEAVRGLIESEGECTWCGWPFKNGIHAYDCAAATTFNLPEGEVVGNSYAKLRTRKGFVLAALES